MLDSLLRKLDSFVGAQLAGWTLQRRSEDEMRHIRDVGLVASREYVVLVRYGSGSHAKKYWWEAPTAAEAVTKAISALVEEQSCQR